MRRKKLLTSAFCFGETRQQIQEFANSPRRKKNWLIYSSPSKTQLRVLPSITIHIFREERALSLWRGGIGVSMETFYFKIFKLDMPFKFFFYIFVTFNF